MRQSEADYLLKIEKKKEDDRSWQLADPSPKIIPLLSIDGTENFLLDIHRNRTILIKGTLQNRARKNLILARLDYGGRPHRNPDGEEVPPLHIHLYKEDYGDKWAYPVDPEIFSSSTDHWTKLTEFLNFCNVSEPPIFNEDLFR